jgi:aminoglycoside phosphotransferase (APT) family kinase protein
MKWDDETIAQLAMLLSGATNSDIAIQAIVPLSGGASSLTARITATRGGAPLLLIVQSTAGEQLIEGAMRKTMQAQLQRRAHAHGLPVAQVIYIFTEIDGFGDGYVMDYIAGENIPQKYLGDPAFAPARAALGQQTAEALAKLHAMNLGALSDLPLRDSAPRQLVEDLFSAYNKFATCSAALELGFSWARRHAPAQSRRALVHGDFRSGNFLVDAQTGLAAVLDWELAHIGDPHEDIGWLCVNSWRFGKWQNPVGGFAARNDFYSDYEKASGIALDRASLHFWELYGTLRWGVSCLQLVHQHVSGEVVSVERAAIGRRISEVELDIMYMLKHGTI